MKFARFLLVASVVINIVLGIEVIYQKTRISELDEQLYVQQLVTAVDQAAFGIVSHQRDSRGGYPSVTSAMEIRSFIRVSMANSLNIVTTSTDGMPSPGVYTIVYEDETTPQPLVRLVDPRGNVVYKVILPASAGM